MSKEETTVARAGASSKEIRQARVRRLVRRIGIWVVIPTLLSILYFGFIAAPQYESTALVRVVSKADGKSKATQVNSMLAKDFGESRGMLDHLVETLAFDSHYKAGGDFLSRLSADASSEDLYDYFRDRVHLKYVVRSGALRITVRAFSGPAAQEFASEILAQTEEMINAMDLKGREARLSLAREQVETAATKLEAAQLALSTLEPTEVPEQPMASIASAARLENTRYQRDVARDAFEASLFSQAKLDEELLKEQVYLAVISAPSLASGASHPRRLWGILTVFVLSFVFMGVFSMLGAALKEHARF